MTSRPAYVIPVWTSPQLTSRERRPDPPQAETEAAADETAPVTEAEPEAEI